MWEFPTFTVSDGFSVSAELCLKLDAELTLHLLTLSFSQSKDLSPQRVMLQVIFSSENGYRWQNIIPLFQLK